MITKKNTYLFKKPKEGELQKTSDRIQKRGIIILQYKSIRLDLILLFMFAEYNRQHPVFLKKNIILCSAPMINYQFSFFIVSEKMSWEDSAIIFANLAHIPHIRQHHSTSLYSSTTMGLKKLISAEVTDVRILPNFPNTRLNLTK